LGPGAALLLRQPDVSGPWCGRARSGGTARLGPRPAAAGCGGDRGRRRWGHRCSRLRPSQWRRGFRLSDPTPRRSVPTTAHGGRSSGGACGLGGTNGVWLLRDADDGGKEGGAAWAHRQRIRAIRGRVRGHCLALGGRPRAFRMGRQWLHISGWQRGFQFSAKPDLGAGSHNGFGPPPASRPGSNHGYRLPLVGYADGQTGIQSRRLSWRDGLLPCQYV